MASSVNPKTIVLLAAEPSADALGAALATSLYHLFPEVQIVGMAGPNMRNVGVDPLWRMEDVSVMGVWEVLKQYRRLRRLQVSIMHELVVLKPDMVIGIDGPDFNLSIEAHVKRFNITAFHYVAPTVWAWRPGRAAKMAEKTMGVLCLFPFEPPYFQVHDLPATFIGHPLAQRLPFVPDKTALRSALGLRSDAPVIAVLPGSRRSEWRYHASLFFDVVRDMRLQQPNIQLVVPCLHEQMKQALLPFTQGLAVLWVIDPQGASNALTAADVALVVSGTASLETALCHTPMVVAYRMHALSHAIISRLLITRWVGLPNIVANASIVPEFLQSQVTVENLSEALLTLLHDHNARDAQCRAFEVIHQQLMPPAEHIAAQTVVEWWRLYEV